MSTVNECGIMELVIMPMDLWGNNV